MNMNVFFMLSSHFSLFTSIFRKCTILLILYYKFLLQNPGLSIPKYFYRYSLPAFKAYHMNQKKYWLIVVAGEEKCSLNTKKSLKLNLNFDFKNGSKVEINILDINCSKKYIYLNNYWNFPYINI